MDGTVTEVLKSLINAYRVVLDLAAMEAKNTLHTMRFMDRANLPTPITNMCTK